QFISPSDKVLFSDDFNTGKKEYTFGFGTYDEGEYLLVVHGINDEVGTYNFLLEEVATPEKLTGESNILGMHDKAQGFISQGTSAIYKLQSNITEPYKLISMKQKDDVRVRIQLISSNDKILFSDDFNTGKKTYKFDIDKREANAKLLVIHGLNGGVGSFHMTLE
ncbi:hypothetical protein AB6E22_18070, partial [Vibrio cyclitrophicus]